MKTSRATAYIHQKRLCVVGIEETELGPVPFAVSVPVEWEHEGPVDFGEELPEPVAEAIDGAQGAIDLTVEDGRQKLAVEDLVMRARQWDQNALAMLQGIRKRAALGDPRAKQSFAYARSFIKRHPPKKTVVFGTETGPAQMARANMARILESQDNPLAMVVCADQFQRYLSPYTVARIFADSGRINEVYACVRAIRPSLEGHSAKAIMRATKEGQALERGRKGDLRPWCCPMSAWELGFTES